MRDDGHRIGANRRGRVVELARRVSSSVNVRPRSGATPNSGKKSSLTCAVMRTSASVSVLSVRPML